jgi:hypothetical protein
MIAAFIRNTSRAPGNYSSLAVVVPTGLADRLVRRFARSADAPQVVTTGL